MSSLLKNLLFALGLALILWLGYVIFMKEDDSLLSSSNSGFSTQAALESQEFLARLNTLKSLKIDDQVFTDQRMTSLVDFRQEITPEPVGRKNPFAPIEE